MGCGKRLIRDSQRGFLLPLALVFLGILLLLLLNLTYQGRTNDQIYLREQLHLQNEVLSFRTQNNLGHQLADPNAPHNDKANLDKNFSDSHERARLDVSWKTGESVHRPVRVAWASFTNLFKTPQERPLASYNTVDTGPGLPPDHTLVRMHSGSGRNKMVAYSAGFPYGAYAPHGEVYLTKAVSWENPSLEVHETAPKAKRYTGLPVDIIAQGEIRIEELYPVGRAYSSSGPVILPLKSGGIGFTGENPAESYSNDLRSQINTQFKEIARDQIDKTHLFDDSVLSVAKLAQVFRGEADFRSIIGVGQAYDVPFFPFPSIQNDILLIVFALHHPWPVDFSGQPHQKELSEELAELMEEIKELDEEKEKLEIELEGLDPEEEKSEYDKVRSELREVKDKLNNRHTRDKEIKEELAATAKDIANQSTVAEVPTNAQEEGEAVTKGWSYFRIAGQLAKIVGALIDGKDPLSGFFENTRVINLGDQDPKFSWQKGGIQMTGTLTVPRGRTLRFTKDFTIRGDLWLQRGSTFHLKGSHLHLEEPGEWRDHLGSKVDSTNFSAFPKGRIIMEPGSTLLVEGDLKVDGGTFELGSVLLVSGLEATRAIDQAILVQGKVEIAHGIHPGMGVDDLIRALAKENNNLKGFVDDFYNPLMVEGFPFIAKFPEVGPWQRRKCWFAEYATTFEVFPEAGPFAGPWPIPLPYPNCMRKVFKYVSLAYSVELNFTTGENLYTQSPLWVFGRGMVPVMTKTDPDLVASSFASIKWEKFVLGSLEKQGEKFIKETLPELLGAVIQTVIQELIEGVIRELIPFVPPKCGGGKAEESAEEKITEQLKEKAKEILKDALKDAGKNLFFGFRQAVLEIRQKVYSHMNDESHPQTIIRELPGVLLYSGDTMRIGSKEARVASGMFFSEGDMRIDADYTVGCLLSGQGQIRAEALYHFPYYSRASLYNPRKPGEYNLKFIDEFFNSALQVAVPDPQKNTALDVGRTMYHVTATGWNR